MTARVGRPRVPEYEPVPPGEGEAPDTWVSGLKAVQAVQVVQAVQAVQAVEAVQAVQATKRKRVSPRGPRVGYTPTNPFELQMLRRTCTPLVSTRQQVDEQVG